MRKQIKIDLAKSNSRSEAYRKQLIAEDVSDEYPLTREVGIVGEALEHLFKEFNVTPPYSFTQWREYVNTVKERAASQLVDDT